MAEECTNYVPAFQVVERASPRAGSACCADQTEETVCQLDAHELLVEERMGEAYWDEVMDESFPASDPPPGPGIHIGPPPR